MDVAEKSGLGALEFLSRARDAERRLVSRTLHDEVGPSLCSAGLLLGMLKASGGETAELAAAAIDALERAVTAVRALTYTADPALAMRCGLRGALESAARALGAQFEFAGSEPAWDTRTASAAFELVRSVLLTAGGGACSLRLDETGVGILGHAPLDETVMEAFQAGAPGLRIFRQESMLKIEAGGGA